MFRWMGGSEGRPAQEQGSPPPPTPQPNTTMPQPQSQIEMGSGASTSAAAYPAEMEAAIRMLSEEEASKRAASQDTAREEEELQLGLALSALEAEGDGAGASSSTTSAAAYPVQVPAMGGPNVSNEMRVTFPSGAPLGVGLLQKDGEVVVDDVQRTSLAEMFERATMIANAKRPLAATSSTLTPRSRLKEDVAYTDALLDAIQEEQKRLDREKRHSV